MATKQPIVLSSDSHELLSPADKLAGTAVQLSSDSGQPLYYGSDGGLMCTPIVALPDDQVLSGDNAGTSRVTLTPTVVGDETNYSIRVDVNLAGGANAIGVVNGNELFVTDLTPAIASLSTSTSTGLVTVSSSVAELSTSTSAMVEQIIDDTAGAISVLSTSITTSLSNANSSVASLSTLTSTTFNSVFSDVDNLNSYVVDGLTAQDAARTSLSTSTSTGLSMVSSAVASLSTNLSTVVSTVSVTIGQLNQEIINTNTALNTQLSTTNSVVQSNAVVASTGLSNARSSVASLSTSTSTSLSSVRSAVASLRTSTVQRFGTPYTKEWTGKLKTATATAVFNVSSAGFASIVSFDATAFLAGATVRNAPIASVVAYTTTSFTVRLLESKTTGVQIGGTVEGLEDHAIAATEVSLTVRGT